MLGNRRPPPQIVLALSLLLGALTAVAAYRYASAENWLPAALWGGVALWLLVDAVRAFGWVRGSNVQGSSVQNSNAQGPGTTPPNRVQPSDHPAATSPRPRVDVNTSPAHTGAPVNPLLQPGSGAASGKVQAGADDQGRVQDA